MTGSDEHDRPQQKDTTMASDPPTDAPRTGNPTAPASESPASVSASRGRRAQPHHRPAATELNSASDAMASLARAIAELVRVEVDARVRAALAERPAVAELLSTAEAALYAKVTPRSIRRWLDEGKLRALHAGRELRIRRADLDELMRSGRRRNAAELTPEELAERDFG
jgi:excisionase family DNA binding protein